MNAYQRQQALKARVKEYRRRVSAAFRTLRKQGYVAKQNYWCCNGCGTSALAQEYGADCEKWLFYNKQAGDRLRAGKQFRLTWGGNGWQIAYALREQGLEVDWNGEDSQTIGVSLPEAQEAAEAA